MEGKARILIYGFSDAEGQRIASALAAVGVPPPVSLRPSQGSVRLSEIILHDRDGVESLAGTVPLVLFHNLSGAGIRTLIPYIRKLQLPRPIFAVVTETSFRWTLAELLEHLVAERRAMERRREEEDARVSSEREAQSDSEGPGVSSAPSDADDNSL